MLQTRCAADADFALLGLVPPACEVRLALEKGGAVIGCAAAHKGEILSIFLQPCWRGKGYGTYFFKRLLRAAETGTQPLCLQAEAPNAPLRALAEKCGFTQAAPQPPDSDAIFYTRRHVPDVSALAVVQMFLRTYVPRGGFAIDATAGNGHDTLFLARLVGETGRVLALDIQPQAVENTLAALAQNGLAARAEVRCMSHAALAGCAAPESVDAVVFNFGYLPGGDHAVFTAPQTSLPALQAALLLLRRGGVLTACLYSGGAQKTDERDALLSFFRSLPPAQYTVLITEFAGRAGGPVPVCVMKK